LAGRTVYAFGGFELDASTRRLTRAGELVPMPDRHLGVLLELVSNPGTILSKDTLIAAVWRDVAVTDNSLEQAISALRRMIGDEQGTPCIQTVARQGYRFAGAVARSAARATDDALDELLAPHRAWIEGRAALETLEGDQIVRARTAFERVLASAPDQASAHVGLANACVLQFEMTRTDARPDAAVLATASHHAREACRLGPDYGEAWATLGFVLDRTGNRIDALAASRRAITLEPDNWRHHLRLAYVTWGEERLREAQRTLALMPGFPLAHWLAATVHVARHALAEAERAAIAGISGQTSSGPAAKFSGVALHWLQGLLLIARGEDDLALAAFERELALEASGHLYARECCANTWYAIGALKLRQGRRDEARGAFEQAIARVAQHPLARIGLNAIDHASVDVTRLPSSPPSFDSALAAAAGLVGAGKHGDAARRVDDALATAPPGNAGWLLPIEPLLHVTAHADIWAPALARLRTRAS
jgi:DNA-binding winged helix-turn-helix (wHTH) protein/Flp pilus assembly protein TadD